MPFPRHLLRRITIALGVGLLASLLYVRLGSGPTPWPFSVLDTFAIYGFIPFLGVAAVALVLRSRALFGVFLVSLLLFCQQFGPLLASELGLSSPSIAGEPETSGLLRVLSLNVQAPNDEPWRLFGVIHEQQPDLIVLQEVNESYAHALNEAIGDIYPYSFIAGAETEHEGAGTWSRFPLSGPEAFRLGDRGNQLHRVRVTTPQGLIWLYNVHLPNPTDPDNADDNPGLLRATWSFNPAHRDAELDALAGEVARLNAPFMIVGDFNVSAESRGYRRIPSSWRDAYAEAGRGFGPTYPAPEHYHEGEQPPLFLRRFSLLRIDYIWTSPALRAVRAWREEVIDTDHLAILADLEAQQLMANSRDEEVLRDVIMAGTDCGRPPARRCRP